MAVAEVFSKERIDFVKKEKSFVKIMTVPARVLYARCTALQSIFQARIQEAHAGGNYDGTYGVLVLC